MNIKTTIILLVLLLGVGGYVFYSQLKDKETDLVKPVVHTLVDVKSSDVTRFVITNSDGKTIEVQKTVDANKLPSWKLTQPVQATADTMKVNTLLDSITSVKSTAEVNGTGSDAPKTGLDKPQYTVDLYAGTNDTKLTVGDSLTVSDGIYVKVGNSDKVDVVASSIADSLSKPANDLRKTQLFETASPSVQQLTITHKDGSQTVLEKQSNKWTMSKPQAEPAETSAVEDLVSSIVNMSPVEFVDEPSLVMGFNKPSAVATFSAAAPSTQPSATTMPDGVTVTFGGYDDVEKKNVFAQLPDGTIVKVAASVLDSINKKPLELRDKTVVDIDPSSVTNLVVALDQPATTQPIAAAVKNVTVVTRRPKTITVGPVLPTTNPTTTVPQTDWVVGVNKPADADDSKVVTLLGNFHPMKADSYLETAPADKLVKKYTVTIATNKTSAITVITIADPGGDQSLICSYNGLNFKIARTVLTDLSAAFTKTAAK